MTAYGYGVPGHDRVHWRGTKLMPFSAPNAERMARKAIESAVRGAGYSCTISDAGATRRKLTINERTLHNGAYVPLATFSYEPKRGGVVAVRIRRLAEEHVAPAQWGEHMPEVLRVEDHVRWTTRTS